MDLPSIQDAKFQLLGMDYDEIISSCSKDEVFQMICEDKSFWKEKIQQLETLGYSSKKIYQDAIDLGRYQYVEALQDRKYEVKGKLIEFVFDHASPEKSALWKNYTKIYIAITRGRNIQSYKPFRAPGNFFVELLLSKDDTLIIYCLDRLIQDPDGDKFWVQGVLQIKKDAPSFDAAKWFVPKIIEMSSNSFNFGKHSTGILKHLRLFRQLMPFKDFVVWVHKIFLLLIGRKKLDDLKSLFDDPTFQETIALSPIETYLFHSSNPPYKSSARVSFEAAQYLISKGFDLSINNNELYRETSDPKLKSLLSTEDEVKDKRNVTYEYAAVKLNSSDPIYGLIKEFISNPLTRDVVYPQMTKDGRHLLLEWSDSDGQPKRLFINSRTLGALKRLILQETMYPVESRGTAEYIKDFISKPMRNLQIFEYRLNKS